MANCVARGARRARTARRADVRTCLADTRDSALVDRFLELDFFLADAMSLVPVDLRRANRTILKSDGRDSLHLAPFARTVLAIQPPSISYGAADSDCLDCANLADNAELHARRLPQEPSDDTARSRGIERKVGEKASERRAA